MMKCKRVSDGLTESSFVAAVRTTWRFEVKGARPGNGSQASGRSGAAVAHESGSELLVSPDGSVALALSPKGRRLFVQRTQRKGERLVAVQCLLIRDVDEFRRWCDVEPIRFEHPVVFDRLRRYGDEVFAHGG